MNATELKYHVQATGSPFFNRDTMRFFGDTMKNYGVRPAKIVTNYDAQGNYIKGNGVVVNVWELFRRRPVKFGLRDSAYFDQETYKKVS